LQVVVPVELLGVLLLLEPVIVLVLEEAIVLRLAVGLGAALQVLLAESLLVRPLVVPVVVRAAVLMGAQRPKDLKKHLSASFSKLQN